MVTESYEDDMLENIRKCLKLKKNKYEKSSGNEKT